MSSRRSRLLGIFLVAAILSLTVYLGQVPFVNADITDTTGGTTNTGLPAAGFVYAFPITVSGSGPLASIGVNWAGTTAGNVMVALYSAGAGKPSSLLGESASTPMSGSTGWQDISVNGLSLTAGTYWVAIQISTSRTVYYTPGSRSYYSKTYAAFENPWSGSSTQDSAAQWNMRVTYEGVPPDFALFTTETGDDYVTCTSSPSRPFLIMFSFTNYNAASQTVQVVFTDADVFNYLVPSGTSISVTQAAGVGTSTTLIIDPLGPDPGDPNPVVGWVSIWSDSGATLSCTVTTVP
jgi:hypothetical protein